MNWKEELEALPPGHKTYEMPNLDAQQAYYQTRGLSTDEVKYSYIPSASLADDPKHVRFTINKTVTEKKLPGGRFNDVFKKVGELPGGTDEYVEVACTPSTVQYLRSLLYGRGKIYYVQTTDNGCRIYKSYVKKSKKSQLLTLLEKHDGVPVNVSADLMPLASMRTFISQYNKTHGTKFSVSENGLEIIIFDKSRVKSLDLSAITVAESAVGNSKLTLEQYDAAVEQWEQLKAKMDELLREPLWRREFAKHI
jgi:hypothetical protein